MSSTRERAWLAAHQKGSKALIQKLEKAHANNPEYQAFKKKHGLGDTSSVKQVSKSTVDRAKEKARQTLAGKAYGATKGTRMGSAEGTGETLRDTIAPLTRDQHSAVKAAEREAKAAEKPAKPAAAPKKPAKPKKEKAAAPAPEKKKPTALELIAAAAAKRKINQIPKQRTANAVRDMERNYDFDDLEDTQYGGRRSYNEEAELDEVAKWRTNPEAHDVDTDGSFLTKNSGDFDNLKARETYLSNAKTYINNKIKNAKNARKQTQSYAKSAIKLYPQKEEVEQVDEGMLDDYIEGKIAKHHANKHNPEINAAHADAAEVTKKIKPFEKKIAQIKKRVSYKNRTHPNYAKTRADLKDAAASIKPLDAERSKHYDRIRDARNKRDSNTDSDVDTYHKWGIVGLGVKKLKQKLTKEEVEQVDEMKSSNPKGIAYKITAASHAANPSYGPHDPSVDPKTNFGAGATRSSAVAGLRAARAIKKAGGNPHDDEHIETISKAIHGSPSDYGGAARGWSKHALTSPNQSPEQKERRSKLTGGYEGLSHDEKEKDRQIARVIAKRVHPVKEEAELDEEINNRITKIHVRGQNVVIHRYDTEAKGTYKKVFHHHSPAAAQQYARKLHKGSMSKPELVIEGVEQVDEASETEYSPHAHSGYSRAIKPGTKIGIHQRPRFGKLGLGKINPAEVTEYHGQDDRGQHMYTVKQGNRTRNITSRSALIRTLKKPSVTKEEVEQVDEMIPYALSAANYQAELRRQEKAKIEHKRRAKEQLDKDSEDTGNPFANWKPVKEAKHSSTIDAMSDAAYKPEVGHNILVGSGQMKMRGKVMKVSDTHVTFENPKSGKKYKTSIGNVVRDRSTRVDEAKHHMGGALFADTAARLQKAINAHKERMDQMTNGPEHEYHHPTLDIRTKSRVKFPAPWVKVEDK